MGFSLGDLNSYKLVGDAIGIDILDPLGAKAQKKANAANEERYQQALALFDQQDPQIGKAYANQRYQLGQAIKTTRKGADRALGEIATLGARGRQAATDAGKRATGQGSRALLQRGMGTSSRLGGLARGVAQDTARAVQGVNEGVAGMRAGVQQDQAARIAQLQTLLGGSMVNEQSALNQWRQGKINAILGREDVAGPGWLSQVASIAAPIVGALG